MYTTIVADVILGVINVISLGNKLDCVIDHITDNRLDIVGITETWFSNDDKNLSVVNTCLDSGYTLHYRPRNTGRKSGGIGYLSVSYRGWYVLAMRKHHLNQWNFSSQLVQ